MIHNKNIYIAIGTTVVVGAIIYLSIYEIFDFKKRSDDEKSCKKDCDKC